MDKYGKWFIFCSHEVSVRTSVGVSLLVPANATLSLTLTNLSQVHEDVEYILRVHIGQNGLYDLKHKFGTFVEKQGWHTLRK